MNRKEVKLSPIKIVAVVLIGLALAFISCFAVISIIGGFEMKEETPSVPKEQKVKQDPEKKQNHSPQTSSDQTADLRRFKKKIIEWQ